jgi:hypothetical protein
MSLDRDGLAYWYAFRQLHVHVVFASGKPPDEVPAARGSGLPNDDPS